MNKEYSLEEQQSRYWIEELYKKSIGRLRRKCFLITGEEQSARDAVQEAFLTALLHPPFENEGKAATWINVVAEHAAIGYLRKKNIQRRNAFDVALITSTETFQGGGVFDYHPIDRKILNSLNKLSELSLTAVVGYMYSIPMQKLSKMQGKSNPTSWQQLKYALSQIKSSLTDGVEIKDKRYGPKRTEMNDKIYKFRKSGWSFKDIATHLDITQQRAIARFNHYIALIKKYPMDFSDLSKYHDMQVIDARVNNIPVWAKKSPANVPGINK